MKITNYTQLSPAQKRTIVYFCLNKNEPVYKIANSLGVTHCVVSDYLSFILTNEEEQNKYLTDDLYDRKNKRFKNTFPAGSYYSHLNGPDDEMMIASDWTPLYNFNDVRWEMGKYTSERRSFSELLKEAIHG